MLKRALWIVVLLVVAGGGAALWMWRRLDQPYRGFSDPEIFVDLPAGSRVSGIARALAAAGVVRDALTFRLAARLSNTERRLEAGEYRFTDAATPYAVAARLARGDVYRVSLVIPEGLTVAEVAPLFERSGLGTAAAFLRAAADATPIRGWDPNAETLEGYLFPDTYAFSRHVGADGAVRAMVRSFERAMSPSLRQDAEAEGLSVRDVVTIASIIEKETSNADERPLVSAVIHNRLKSGMPLQCDPTVIFAMMQAGRWNGNITRADLQIDSRYNTYRYPGLPPGPIAAPGRASLDAAVHPAGVSYLYFVSRNDGTHAFATTLAEHNRNVERYQSGRGAGVTRVRVPR